MASPNLTPVFELNAAEYHSSPQQQMRLRSIFGMLPRGRSTVLDIGAFDGYITQLLTEHFGHVTALDLEKPPFTIDRVTTVQGDATNLEFADGSFDTVFCTEVLEHIPPAACRELARVARHEIVLGVPYRQELRTGRTTCAHCGTKNPPWANLNSFDEAILDRLFEPLQAVHTEYIGRKKDQTNAVPVWLNDLAGNPWGNYDQVEPCIKCNQR